MRVRCPVCGAEVETGPLRFGPDGLALVVLIHGGHCIAAYYDLQVSRGAPSSQLPA
jgi:hypothetical protein